jgi:hypothetical protein
MHITERLAKPRQVAPSPGLVDACTVEDLRPTGTNFRLQGRRTLLDEWAVIDNHSIFECTISPCSHLLDVPATLKVPWASAAVDVFKFIDSARTAGDSVALERGLKWHLCLHLHDVLLRRPPRTTRGAGRATGEVEARFSAWAAGDRAHLFARWAADRTMSWS